MKKSLGKLSLTYIQLETIITEVTVIINSRPLIYVDDDFENRIITPSDFINKGRNVIIQETESIEEDCDPDYKRKISKKDDLLLLWKKGQKHLERFWKIWRDQYLLSMRERTQYSHKQKRVLATDQPKKGDIVLIKENLPRGSWKVGRILEIIQSLDGSIRSAEVRLPTGKTTKRSVCHLYPIECTSDEGENKNLEIDENQITESRPTRKAAKIAKQKIQLQATQ